MRPLLLAALLLAPALAGCALPASGGLDCRPAIVASWEDPALFARLWEGDAEGWRVNRTEPEPGIPAVVEELEPFAPYSLLQVWWSPDKRPEGRERDADELWLRARWGEQEGPLLHVSTAAEPDRAQLRERFDRFVRPLTDATDAELDAWFDELLAEASPAVTDGSGRVVAVGYDLRLPRADATALYADVSASEPPAEPVFSGGHGRVGRAFGAWEFGFAVRSVEAWREADGATVVLTTSATGGVSYLHKGPGDSAAAHAALARAYEDLGLGGVPVPQERMARMPDKCAMV